MDDFPRLQRLPPYVFNITGELKAAARKGANQAGAAARQGWPTEMVGCVGRDGFAAQVRRDLEATGAGCGAVTEVDGSSGVAAITTVAGGENTIVIAAGANEAMDVAAVEAAWPVIASAGMVLLQLEIPLETVMEVARRCAAAGVPVMLDPAPARALSEELLRSVRWLTPNETEAEVLCGVSLRDASEAALDDAASRLMAMGAWGVALKLGGRGVYVATADETRAGNSTEP